MRINLENITIYITAILLICTYLPFQASAQEKIYWGYDGEGSPENWGKIKGEFKDCRLGRLQSPIDIVPTITANLPNINIHYKTVPLKILNNGHTIQINYPAGSKMVVGGVVYNLLQLHFHANSENAIKGKIYDMEMHLVHSTKDGKLGVLGVMIKEGRSNEVIGKIWKYMPMSKAAETIHENVKYNVQSLLPNNLDYYRFMGSLTTPPCSEGVNWHVLKNPIQLSKTQIAKFKKAFPMNSRPLQPANNRLVISEIIKQKVIKE